MSETLPYVSSPDALPYGSRIVTIGAVTYIANNFRINRTTTRLRRKNQVGAPNGLRLLKEPKTATADLQLATNATPLPARGNEFAGEAKDEVAAWVIADVGDEEQNDGLKTVSITCEEKI